MADRKRGEWGYLIVWEFQVHEGMEKSFEMVYGARGQWAQLFMQDQSYVETELIRSLKSARSYMTLDFWTSQGAYEAFRERHAAEYKTIDEKCEQMTESEREIGRFVRVGDQTK